MSLSVPAGRIAGISIRIHLLFFIFVITRIIDLSRSNALGGVTFGLALFAGLYLCILLHEFGHALSARWCGGEADEILIWPLGGLAYCNPPLNPTPHLITTLGGPFVTLVIWAVLTPVAWLIRPEAAVSPLFQPDTFHDWTWWYLDQLAEMNGYLLLFNLVPAFPMDGGRALRDTLWHHMPVQKANRITGVVGIIASIFLIVWGVRSQNEMMIFIGIFTIFGAAQEFAAYQYVEAWQIVPWSLKEHLGLNRRPLNSRRQTAAKPGKALKRTKRHDSAVPLPYEAKMAPRLDVSPERKPVEKIDAILEKISRSGIDSLDEWEKRELDRASRELKRQDD